MASQAGEASKQQDGGCKEVVIDIKKDLSYLPSRDNTCISRVPQRLRNQNEAAYTPQLVSIGPLHHGASELQFMEAYKLKYLQTFLDRAKKKRSDKEEDKLDQEEDKLEQEKDNLLGLIKKRKDEIQRCYEETFEGWCPDKFANMVLLDSAFIIEISYMEKKISCMEADKEIEDDFIMGNPWLTTAIKQDLILLENQLPYFIIKDIYKEVGGSLEDIDQSYLLECYTNLGKPPQTKRMCNCDCSFFDIFYCFCCHCGVPQIEAAGDDLSQVQGKHFTDYVRQRLSKGHPQNMDQGKQDGYKHRIPATKLEKAGVKFRAYGDSLHPLKTSFKKGVLKMPYLEFQDSTERLFRNIMAYEQRHCPQEAYICGYVMFMNSLIDSDKDVELLVDNGVIYNGLGDNKALAELVNCLDKEIVVDENLCFNEICIALHKHNKNWWYNFVAEIRRIYFTDCWKTTLTIAGLFFLFLTLVTSINSVIEIFT